MIDSPSVRFEIFKWTNLQKFAKIKHLACCKCFFSKLFISSFLSSLVARRSRVSLFRGSIRARFKHDSDIGCEIERWQWSVSYREIRSMDWQPLWEIQGGSHSSLWNYSSEVGQYVRTVVRLPWRILLSPSSSLLRVYELTRFLSQATKGTGSRLEQTRD